MSTNRTNLSVIEGGKALGEIQSLVAAEMALPVGEAAAREALLAAEKDISTVTDVIAPAIAIVSKPAAILAQLVAAADLDDAVQAKVAFKRATAAAKALFETIASAETKLRTAITDVVLDELSALERE
jgi:hypothetical protein